MKVENVFGVVQKRIYLYQEYRLSKTRLSHFGKSPSICFWPKLWFIPESTKLDSAHHLYLQVLLYNSLETPDLWKWSATWISRASWNRRFSAPSSPSSWLQNCVHPQKVGLTMGFVQIKFFLRKGVRAAHVLFLLFFCSNQPKGKVTKY